MEKGQVVEIKIEDMSAEGQGIGKAEGFVVFVPGAVVGDVVKAQLTKVKKSYGFAKMVEMVCPSEDRTDQFDCEFFDNGCGGCQYGRLSYDAQLALKERQVREKLQRIAGIDEPLVRPIIGMEEDDNDGNGPFRYRNKAQFPVSTGGIITRKGGIVENLGDPAVGFYRAKSHEVVDCGDCYLQSMAAMAAADALRRFMEEDNITAWDPKWEKGLMRHLIVKTGFESGEVMVILVINGNGVPNIQKLVEMLDDAIYEVGYSLESVVLSIKKSEGLKSGGNVKGSGKNCRGKKKSKGAKTQPQMNSTTGSSESVNRYMNSAAGNSESANIHIAHGMNEIMGDKNIVVAGKPVIKDSVGGVGFEISPASFYQVNPVQMKRLYDKVREYCGFCAGDAKAEQAVTKGEKPVILDLYCGVGSIGIYCADSAEAIVGIEAVKEAVIDANRNAVINGIVNARYICGKAEEVLAEYAACDGENASDPHDPRDMYDSDEKSEECKTLDGNESYNEGRSIKVDPDIAKLIKKADVAIIDPPRAGCKPELLEAVADVGVDRIVYVSCDPATLARDIKLLGEMGYEFVEATPVDMFPWTGHVETVVLLSHKKPDGHINVKIELGEGEGKVPLDNIAKRAESYKPKERVTYKMIKEYIEAKYGFKVHTAYIAEVKRDLGLPMYDAPNAVEKLKQPRKHPTAEKVEAIKDALKHFEVI